ncbi:MAG: hypothetical protein L6R37_007085 [Teloschistes peruensis]|nr:MAG: hypothetical protein L6R37_007085 [Teloschistes peruensis]
MPPPQFIYMVTKTIAHFGNRRINPLAAIPRIATHQGTFNDRQRAIGFACFRLSVSTPTNGWMLAPIFMRFEPRETYVFFMMAMNEFWVAMMLLVERREVGEMRAAAMEAVDGGEGGEEGAVEKETLEEGEIDETVD